MEPRGPESLWRRVRDLPRPVWVLCTGTFVNRFGSFVSVFLVLYLTASGYGPAQAGLAVAAYGAGSLVSALAGGYLADRLGRRNAIAISMFSAAGAALGLGAARGLLPIASLAALFGLASELYRPAASALLADLVPQGRRVPAYAAYRLAVNAGFAAGPAVAGFLADISFWWVFVGEAATSAVYGFVALAGLPESRRVRRHEEEPGAALRSILGNRPFVLLCLGTLLGAFVYMQATTTLPLHVRDSGHSAAVFGVLISLNGLLIVLAELPLTSFTHRMPARPVIAAGMILSGIGFGVNAWAHSILPLAAGVLIFTVGEMTAAPIGSAYAADLADGRYQGRYQGAFTLMFALGAVLAPAAGTALYARSPVLLWAACFAVAVAAGGLILLSGGSRRVTRAAVVTSETDGRA